jgi:hypothetical protein
MCINNTIFGKPNTYLTLLLSILTYIHSCITVHASLACISVAIMSPLESFADIKGEYFGFHYRPHVTAIVGRPEHPQSAYVGLRTTAIPTPATSLSHPKVTYQLLQLSLS